MERVGYECSKCGRMVPVRSKGMCPACRAKYLENSSREKKTDNLFTLKKSKNKRPELSGFFNDMLDELEYSRLSATGKPIHGPSTCNICHILPKRTYKSVATERDNIIFLTKDEHTRFDELLDRLEFELLEKEFDNAWKVALFKIRKMDNDKKIKESGKIFNSIKDKYHGKSDKII